jgi:hypothetical protein
MKVLDPAIAVLPNVGMETGDGGTGFIGFQGGAEFGVVNDQVPKSAGGNAPNRSRNRII